jgi:hypothetical protein
MRDILVENWDDPEGRTSQRALGEFESGFASGFYIKEIENQHLSSNQQCARAALRMNPVRLGLKFRDVIVSTFIGSVG